MPGIVGLITKKGKEEASQLLAAMLSSVSRENFYSKAAWVDESVGVYVGWTARKGSFCDGMPLRNELGDVMLLFSGEEYPEPGMAQTLRARGHDFNPEGPSYLVHLYEEDTEFPAGLNGRFHGLLVDRRRDRAMLFTDRFGMHRLYFHESADTFYFAAEAKAILAVCPELRSPNWQSLAEVVSCGAVLENRTIFQDIQVLPPASAWTLRAGTIEKRTSYFNASEWEEQGTLDPESYYEALSHTFIQNLPRYFQGRERIAMSLTAGLDTRMVMACANEPPGSLPCYTFGSMFRENQDVRNARKVARA